MNSMDKLCGTVLEIDMNPVSFNILAYMLSEQPVKYLRADTPEQGIKLAERE